MDGLVLDSATWHSLGRALGKHLRVLFGLTGELMFGKILVRVIWVIKYLKSLLVGKKSLGARLALPWNQLSESPN